MKRIAILIFIALLPAIVQASVVDRPKAELVALNWFNQYNTSAMQQARIAQVTELTHANKVSLYVVHFEGKGFIIVAADDASLPILGSSFDTEIKIPVTNPGLSGLLENYHKQIAHIRSNGLSNETTLPAWVEILENRFNSMNAVQGVGPLLTTKWDQIWPYNELCPRDAGAPSYQYGHVPTGCVATAMAQVMKFHNYPQYGWGYHEYVSETYGNLYAHFACPGASQIPCVEPYEWANMPNQLPLDPNVHSIPIARLIYHCAVAVNTMFSRDEGAAYPEYIAPALINNFGYNTSMNWISKSSYPDDAQWIAALKTELNATRPILYCGWGTGGHAFVCDGYTDIGTTTKFHFNWGWGGYGDADFFIGSLNPGGDDFNSDNIALVGVRPAPTFTIQGHLTSTTGAAMPWVRIMGGETDEGDGLPGWPQSDAQGNYTAQVFSGWTGWIRPWTLSYDFLDPSFRTYTTVTSNITGQDYTAKSWGVYGRVTSSLGSPIAGVVMNGLPGNPQTDSNGEYAWRQSWPPTWKGTVSPQKAGYVFTPASRTYTSVYRVIQNQDYVSQTTSTLLMLSGRVTTASGVPIVGVTITGLPSTPQTDSSGLFYAHIPNGWSGQITPSKQGHTFSPLSLTYSNVTTSQYNQNFTATPPGISGRITSGGSGVSGVLLKGLPGNPTTNSNGDYVVILPYGWAGTVHPYKQGYGFTPSQRVYGPVSAMVTNQDYQAAQASMQTIAGNIRCSSGPLAGVFIDGFPDTIVSDANGNYVGTVYTGWSGAVKPRASGYTFNPTSKWYDTYAGGLQQENYEGCVVHWQAIVDVQTNGGRTASLIFGQANGATAGIDATMGEAQLPPPAPGFDARFVLPASSTPASLKDFRTQTTLSETWRLTFQPDVFGYPIVFTWSNALPSGTWRLLDEIGGNIVNVDMRNQFQYTLTNGAISALQIQFTSSNTSRTVSASAGWNMLSVPLINQDMRPEMIYPGAVAPPYWYSNGYVIPALLSPGRGYWFRFAAPVTFTQVGTAVTPKEIIVRTGWNMIGAFETDAIAQSITTIPTDIIVSPFYGYANGYTTASTLRVGNGYWIRVSQDGRLVLPSGFMKVRERPTESSNEDWTPITVRDANQGVQTLYLNALFNAEHPASQYALPPKAPSGIFDVRFDDDTRAVSYNQAVIRVQGNALPFEVTCRSGRFLVTVLDGKSAGYSSTLSPSTPVIVSDAAEVRISIAELQSLPTTFALGQNYPNPFNPETIIEFATPVTSHVKLEVFNTLGQRVADLVDEIREAGYYTERFDASQLATGIYFYRLQAGNFLEVRKLVVLK